MFQSTGKNESVSNAELSVSSNNDSEEDEGSWDSDSNKSETSDKNNDIDTDSDSSDGDDNDDASDTAKSNASDGSDSESIDSKDSLPVSPKKSTFFADGKNEKAMYLLGKGIKDVKDAGSKGEMSEIFSDKNGNSYIAVDCGELSSAWWIDPMFVIQCIQACVQSTPGAKKDTKWPLTIDVVNIRAGQHGDNHYKRDGRTRMIKHLIFIMELKKKEEHHIYIRAERRAKYLFESMVKLAEDGSAKQALDLMEGGSIQRNDGTWNGLYGFFTKGRDKSTVISRLKNDIKNQFKNEVQFCKERFKFDKYFTDYDIKEIAKNIFNAKSWEDVPLDARKVFYKDNYGSKFIPNWNEIIEEPCC